MFKIILAATVFAAMSSAVIAQIPARNGPDNAAVKGVHENNSDAPVAGSNSFTKAQATKQIEAEGYTNVSNLILDKSGVWRGMAMKNGESVPVSVDFQGNVN